MQLISFVFLRFGADVPGSFRFGAFGFPVKRLAVTL
jgi:hypothetical protein